MPRPPLLYNWKRSYQQPTRWRASGALSVVAHVALVSLALRATANPVVFDSPRVEAVMYRVLNRAPKDMTAEHTHYVTLGFAATPDVAVVPAAPAEARAGPHEREPAPTPSVAAASQATSDTFYTSYQVDSTAEALADNSGPAYPPQLVRNRIEGAVVAQYVVDTTGRADTTNIEILESAHPLFSAAVRTALVGMRYRPARVGSLRVRQLVYQKFTFRLAADTARPPSLPTALLTKNP